MNVFTCPVCDNQLYFENYACAECDAPLGFWADELMIIALEDEGDEIWSGRGDTSHLGSFRRCANHDLIGCNWLVSVNDEEPHCASCRLTTDIVDLSVEEDRKAWALLERAKRRLIYGLKRLGLPIESHAERDNGLRFRLLKGTADEPVMTGHDNGTITINVSEANDAYREKQRALMGESYRTALGHFRHEIGHYYFDRLVQCSPHIKACRKLFGDERVSYEESLKRHYKEGAPADYADSYISEYATMHPWEDWAESWAHYMHMISTLETAQSYGIAVDREDGLPIKTKSVDLSDFEAVMRAWVPVTLAINGLNRSMGLADAYPFAISGPVKDKLAFIHSIIHGGEVAANRARLASRESELTDNSLPAEAV